MKSLLKGILTNIHTKLHQFLISSSVVFAQTERHAHTHTHGETLLKTIPVAPLSWHAGKKGQYPATNKADSNQNGRNL